MKGMIFIMNDRTFAARLYEFLKNNDALGHFEHIPAEDGITELEHYLSDLDYVKDTLKDIEEISETNNDYDFYNAEIKPLVNGLTEIRGRLEAERNKRMVGNTGYEVKFSAHLGDREIVVAENMNAGDGNCYFIADYRENGLIAEYSRCQTSGNYLEIMGEYAARLMRQVDALNAEIGANDYQAEIVTPEQCYPNDYGEDITNTVVAIKADVLRSEYRRGDVQIVCVTGGSGARSNPRGTGVYCFHLNDGKQTRFERHDIQGRVKKLPNWTKKRLEVLLTARESEKQTTFETVGGYKITNRIETGRTLFVLGENLNAPSPFVTWQRSAGRSGYDLGHYHQSREAAVKDLHDRANNARENQALGLNRKAKNRNHDAR
jgi:hypothetical protein